MIRGMEVAAQGMLSENWRVGIYTNNVSNASTNGFKRDELAIGVTFQDQLRRVDDNQSPSRPMIGSMTSKDFDYLFQTDQQSGGARETGNPTDLFISGSGLFTIKGQNAEIYTRNGNFVTNMKGELVTQEGFNVMGEKGPIVLPANKKFSIDEDGRIVSEGKVIDRILIKNFANPEKLMKLGNSFFLAGPSMIPQVGGATIKQGFVEGSNVNVIKEMVNIMEAQKAYQANERSIRAHMEALTQAVTSVGRVG